MANSNYCCRQRVSGSILLFEQLDTGQAFLVKCAYIIN